MEILSEWFRYRGEGQDRNDSSKGNLTVNRNDKTFLNTHFKETVDTKLTNATVSKQAFAFINKKIKEIKTKKIKKWKHLLENKSR